MLSKKLHDALNEQMNFEFYSAHAYMAMAAYCTAESYDGFANFFLVQAEEERFHAMKLYNYINDRGERAIITGFDNPNNEYESVLNAFEVALEHEREHATITFLKWFVDEQVEEEASFDSIIQKLKRITSDSNALFMLDAELEKRTFTPPAE